MSENEAGKRTREHDAVLDFDSLHAKKIRFDLFDVLNETDPDPATHDLESVIRSLEVELMSSSSSQSPVTETSQPDVGFLLKASDDMGLPPSIATSSKYGEEIEGLDFGCEGVGLGEIWRFEEAEAAAEFGAEVGSGGSDYLALDGLFDYSNLGFG